MTAADVVVLAAVGLGLFFSLRSVFRKKGGCYGNCAVCHGCSGCRGSKKPQK